ncbi:hypothetical protein FB561_2418 [Kribbella amoyensis]|uniref:Type VII secretion protein EccE n=1 Tax=Kribbella amoyensis TaxID=996641 RepID=A0A561BR02_9ACTN|nr:hypothetical protein [Kribbella amoyensis]TWD81306.1 hypothetical protein FB561_2418 [Kribbella amoyensis]
MRPPPAAATAPAEAETGNRTAPAVPRSTSVGQPIARAVAIPEHRPAQRPVPAQAALGGQLASRSYLVEEPTAPTPSHDKPTLPERAIRVGQVIAWQVAVVLIGAASAGSRLVFVLTTLGALTVILLTALRVRGLWLYRWIGIFLLFLFRRHRFELGGSTALDLVGVFRGRTSVDSIVVRDHPYGLLSRPDVVNVVIRVGADAQYEILPRLVAVTEAADEQPVAVSVQLVLHRGTKHDRSPRSWIAVAARRTPDFATDEQLGPILANTVRRLVRKLDRDQLGQMPLDIDDTLASLSALAHVNAGRGQLRERWGSWAAGPIQQVCLRMAGYSALPRPAAQALVDALLGTATGCAHTLAVTVTAAADTDRTTTGPVQHDAVLRVAGAHPATLDAAVSVLTTLARSFGVEPERLDGRHPAGVAATLPLGVSLS